MTAKPGDVTDTSAENVERLAFRLENIEAYPFTSSRDTMRDGAAMLRALSAELERVKAERDELRSTFIEYFCAAQNYHVMMYDAKTISAYNVARNHALEVLEIDE